MTNALHKTYLVSFPRSGQHLVARGLMWILPDLVVYSENYQVEHKFSNNPAVNIQKEHDFDLVLPFLPEYRYVVLLRDYESAIQSWWRFNVGNGTFKDTEASFREFVKGKLEYWNAFRDTWMPRVKYNTDKNIMFFEFRQLRSDPANCMKYIVDFVVRDIPQVLSYENNRAESYATFAACCKQWASVPVPKFPYSL